MNLGKIVSGALLIGFLITPYSNLHAEDKKETISNDQCETVNEEFFYIFNIIKRNDLQGYIIILDISRYPEGKSKIYYKCAKEYVESKFGKSYGISKKEEDGKMKIVVFQKEKMI